MSILAIDAGTTGVTALVIGTDATGRELCSAELQTAGDPVALRLKAITNPAGFKADAADLALVEVEVIDAQGRRCPTALNLVDFDLTGPAEWRGGIAQGPDNYILSKSLPVECGVNRVLVRSTTTAGKILVTAKAAGLKNAALELTTQPIEVAGGLAAAHPAEGIAPYLKRGPTPAGPSFKRTRIAVPVARATAGTITAAECTRLIAACESDPAVLEELRRHVEMERLLAFQAQCSSKKPASAMPPGT